MSLRQETKNVLAFQLVSEALTLLDAHQQAQDAKPQPLGAEAKPPDAAAQSRAAEVLAHDAEAQLQAEMLTKADILLQAALIKDPGYFKARYLQAMVSYLRDAKLILTETRMNELVDELEHEYQWDIGTRTNGLVGFLESKTKYATVRTPKDGAVGQFLALLEEPYLLPLERAEIHYNLGAASFKEEAYDNAITFFELAARGTKAEPESYLLAKTGVANALAEKAKREPSEAVEEIKEVRRLCRYVKRRLTMNFFYWLFNEKSIDGKVVRKIKQLIDDALETVEGIKPAKPTAPTTSEIKSTGEVFHFDPVDSSDPGAVATED